MMHKWDMILPLIALGASFAIAELANYRKAFIAFLIVAAFVIGRFGAVG